MVDDHKPVGYWLLGSAASVFGLIVFGGLTRLTESGLSITEWRPVTGSLPPWSTEQWEVEFEKYRSSPEFQVLNPHMDLTGFKKIYYMEWTHRQWGRLVALTFVLPAAYFIWKRQVSVKMAIKLVGIGGLIGFQGVLGWWMVKSGLKDELFAPGSHPRVSQYGLVAHLTTAILCYTAMLWNGHGIFRNCFLLANPRRAVKGLRWPGFNLLKRPVALLACLVFVTAMSGALVAGLDAGLIYNEFPFMGDGLTPPKSELFSDLYARRPDRSDRWWRNMFENPSTVQLEHRILAATTFTAVMALWAYSRFSRRVAARMPRSIRTHIRRTVYLVWLQVVLGISTLIYLVPVPLAAAHQASALALLSAVVLMASRLRVPKSTLLLLNIRLARYRRLTVSRS
ncbi:MAG: Cytochrome c oxidase assembly protein cox15 [Phylliscum demangeonii]|nr:MAG: Cytochrome c oxidase assembly protein cox15 [Phylliscum demangeonii]